MNLRPILLLAAFGLLLASAAQAQHDAPVLVSTEWLTEHLGDDDLVILNVHMAHTGLPAEYIPGARFVDYHELEDTVDEIPIELPPVDHLVEVFRAAGVSNDKHVVIYGVNPAHEAARAFMTLEYLGHRGKTSMLDGGFELWKAEDRPTVAEAATAPRGDFEAHVDEDLLISADELAEHLDDPHLALIDARPAKQHAEGFIPGSYNLYWHDLIVSDEVPRLKDLDDVKARFHAAGATKDGLVVNYCQIGMRASYTYLISRHLGYRTRFYDGSFSEWGPRYDLPREKKVSVE